MTSRLTLLTLVLFLFNFQPVHAQDLDTVSLFGRVTDQTGALIPGAEIEATIAKTQLRRKTTTDAQGRYRLIQLEPGNYTLRISAHGFATQQLENIAALSSQALQFDITLIPATVIVEPVIITTAEPPIIDTKRTVTGTTINLDETKSLPLTTRS